MAKRFILALVLSALAFVPIAHSDLKFLPAGDQPSDYFIDVAMGRVAGVSVVEKFGENPDIDSGGTFEDIWDGGAIYANPTATSLHNVVSSLAADTGDLISSGTAEGGSFTTLVDDDADFVTDVVAAGDMVLNDSNVMIGFVTAVTDLNTLAIAGEMRNPNSGRPSPGSDVVNTSTFGVANASGDTYRIVRDGSTGAAMLWIQGLSGSLIEQEEFIRLNGVGVVATAKLYSTQYRARIFTTGNAGAVGNITSTAQSGSTVSAQVIGGTNTANQTLMAVYTCAIDKECLIVFWAASMSKAVPNAIADLHLMGGTISNPRYILQTSSITTTGSSTYPHPYPIPVPIPGGSAVWLAANSSANEVGVSGRMTILVKDLQ